MSLRFFQLSFLFFFFPSAHADPIDALRRIEQKECNHYDLSHKFPWPSRDQDSMGWCFGFIGADIISAKLKKQVSAADVSMNYFYGKNDDLSAKAREQRLDFIRTFSNGGYVDVSFALGRKSGSINEIDKLSGGWMNKSIDATQYRGACLESDFPSEDYRFSRHIYNLKTLLRSLEANQSTETPEAYIEAVNEVTSSLPVAKQKDVIAALSDRDLDPFSSLGDKLCKNRIPFRFNHLKDHWFSNEHVDYPKEKKQKYSTVNKNLAAGHPMSIAYSSKVLYDPKAKRSKSGHASIILGQRFNPKNNKCELLLRNSWGDCGYAHKSYECNKKNGHIWLPRDALLKNTYGIHEAY